MALQQAGLMPTAKCRRVSLELLHGQLLGPLSFGAAGAGAGAAAAVADADAIAGLHCHALF
jgi:hypothetical protein